MDALQLIKQISLQDTGVYCILGTETYLAQQIKNKFIEIVPEHERQFNVGQYDMEDTPVSVAIDDARSVPFFGERRIVIINNPFFLTGENKKIKVEHNLDELLDYIEHPLDSTILLIMANYDKLDARKKIVKALKKSSYMIDNKPLSEQMIKKYVASIVTQKDYVISMDALNLLIRRTGAQLTTIINELDKLFLSAMDTHEITIHEVERLVPVSLEQNIFDIVDLVLRNNVSKSIQMYNALLQQKEEPLKINAILVGQFRLLMQVAILSRRGYSQGDIASTVKVHPYRVKLAMQMINRFPINALEDAYLGLVDVEEQLKTTQREPELLFQLFLIRYSQDMR